MTWPATPLATGELVSAATLNQIPLALAKVTATSSSVDFTDIPQYWTNLHILACVQDDSGNNSDTLKITFNGDSSSGKYTWQRLRAQNTTVDATSNVSQNYINGGEVPGKTAGFSIHSIYIPNYTLVQPHQVSARGYAPWDNTSANGHMVFSTGGLWKPTASAAITQVTLTPATGSFVTGSVAMLYGGGQF